MNAKHFLDPDIFRVVPHAPGVYWMIWSKSSYGQGAVGPRPIPRLAGVDPWGILYIGCAGDLYDRATIGLVKLTNDAEPSWLWPALGDRYMLLDYLHSFHGLWTIPKENLAIAWEVLPSRVEANKTEQMMYYNYRQHFSELPPFQRDFSMGLWIKSLEEKNMRGPLLMPTDRYFPG